MGDASQELRLFGDIAPGPDRTNGERGEARYREHWRSPGAARDAPLVAHCHLGLGKLYRRTSQREQAHEHLTTATTMYREMGMTSG